MNEGNWIILEDQGWKIVMPEQDTLPHSTDTKGKKRELAWSKCPCKPRVSWKDRMVVHNSFEDAATVA